MYAYILCTSWHQQNDELSLSKDDICFSFDIYQQINKIQPYNKYLYTWQFNNLILTHTHKRQNMIK